MTATVIRPLVTVIDDDESVRESLPDLLKAFGYSARVFSSAEAFLSSDCVGKSRCLILDVVMPGMSGPDLEQELIARGLRIPIIYITADLDDAVRARLPEAQVTRCLKKPFRDTALLDSLRAALEVDGRQGDAR
jgi:FixJ family two-component response regulator